MDLPTSLKAARKAKRLTQEQVAAALNVTRPAVTQWESGRTIPDPENLRGMAEIYGMDVEQLAALLPAGDAAVFRAYSARNHAMAQPPSILTERQRRALAALEQLPEDRQDEEIAVLEERVRKIAAARKLPPQDG